MKIANKQLLNRIVAFVTTIIATIAFIQTPITVYSQETLISNSSIKLALGLGSAQMTPRDAQGFVFSAGWQANYGAKNKLRINPNLSYGKFESAYNFLPKKNSTITSTSIDFTVHYDALRYRSFSLVTSLGNFITKYRVIVQSDSIDSTTLSIGLKPSIGIRFVPKNSSIALEYKPITLYFGTQNVFYVTSTINLDIKIAKCK